MVQEAVSCNEREAAGIIEFMDRHYTNPEWSTIDMEKLREHLRGVLADMSRDSVAVQELRSMFGSTNDDPFYRPYKTATEEAE
jgi:hypothetical protein